MDSFEHSNETSGSVTDGEFLEVSERENEQGVLLGSWASLMTLDDTSGNSWQVTDKSNGRIKRKDQQNYVTRSSKCLITCQVLLATIQFNFAYCFV